jgi:magnesium chelatase family protein
MQPVAWSELDAPAAAPTSRLVRARVGEARQRAVKRAGGHYRTNAEIPDAQLEVAVAATPDARTLLGRAVSRLGLSARAARRTLRVARTIADLAGDAQTGRDAIAEAIGYRDRIPRGE